MWPFQKKVKARYSIHHPEFLGRIELAFKLGGVQYYRFKEEIDIPYGRYKEVSAYLHEVSLRMDLKTLNAYLDNIEQHISGGRGEINLVKACETIAKMKTRTALAFEPESAKRLASVVFFDDTEDLTAFSREKAKQKMDLWDREGSLDFFTTMPMSALLGLSGTSVSSLNDYIREATEILRDLTSEPTDQSSATT